MKTNDHFGIFSKFTTYFLDTTRVAVAFLL